MIYVLAYPQFEPSVAERIRRFRIENEPARAELVPPHVTLVFGLTNILPHEFQEHCEAVASRSSQFEVSFVSEEITHDPFEKTHKLLLVSSTGSSQLAALHEQLYEGVQRAERKDDIPYRPHMTVATNPDRTIIVSDVSAPLMFRLRSPARWRCRLAFADFRTHMSSPGSPG